MKQLEEIYARIPEMHCKGKCRDSCGPIAMSHAEARVVTAVSEGAVQTSHTAFGEMVNNFDQKTLRCPALQNGRCSIYANRPLICRLWGAVKKMRCPWGCRPKRWISREESYALLEKVSRIV